MVLKSLANIAGKYEKGIYIVFRVVVGLLFLMHGLQKFGVFGGNSVDLLTKFGIAGVIEIVVGIAVILSIFIRLAALIGFVEMLVAFFTVHMPGGINPLKNGGELSLLFAMCFLVIFMIGKGKRKQT